MSRKRSGRPADWSIVFEDASALRNVVDAVLAVMPRGVFKVAKQGSHHFLMVDGADAANTCCVSARLQLDTVDLPEGAEESFEFCVECKHVLTAIDSASCAHGKLTVEGHDDKVRLRVHDPDQRSHEDCSEIPTYVDFEPPVDLLTMTYGTLLEIDMAKLRELIKKARKSKCDLLRIAIHLKDRGAKQQSLVVFSVDGEAYHSQAFCHETTRDEDGSLVVRAAPDGSDDLFDTSGTDPTFEGVYPIEKVEAFIKSLPCRMLGAKVQSDLPLMLSHTLGGASDDSSHVRFLVAPVNEDD